MVRDEELTKLEYLGQRLSSQKPILRDYACNLNADKVVALDILIKSLPEGSKKRRILEKVREILLAQGEGSLGSKCGSLYPALYQSRFYHKESEL